MTDSMNLVQASSAAGRITPAGGSELRQPESSELGVKFEKMLWAEMLRHAGLEKAMTRSGGEGASAFAQFMVEAIAEDIARRSPLGLDPAGLSAQASSYSGQAAGDHDRNSD